MGLPSSTRNTRTELQIHFQATVPALTIPSCAPRLGRLGSSITIQELRRMTGYAQY